MTNSKKIVLSKRFVISGWILAIIGAVFLNYVAIFLTDSEHAFFIPNWCIALFVLASIVMVTGVLFGSRGIGKPLTAEILFSIVFGYPNWIPAVIYLFFVFVVPVVHRYIL